MGGLVFYSVSIGIFFDCMVGIKGNQNKDEYFRWIKGNERRELNIYNNIMLTKKILSVHETNYNHI